MLYPPRIDISKDKPWVVDQVLEIVECAHLQAIRLSAPFDWPHYPSANLIYTK